MTEGQIEITVVPTKAMVMEAALLSRKARLLKWHIILIGGILISGVAEVVNDGIPIKGEAIGFVIFLGFYIGIMKFYRRRFLKKMQGLLEGRNFGKVKCTFTTDALILLSEIGQEILSWNKIREITASSDLLVLTSNEGVIAPLPISDLQKEIIFFIRRKILENRIRVFGRQAKTVLAMSSK